MSRARHPKAYNEGIRKQMTPEWKQLVRDRLEENAAAGIRPMNIDQLAAMVGAKKGGLNRTFSTNQTSSSYVDKICEVLGIDPPLQPTTDMDDDAKRLLAFPPEIRRRLVEVGKRLAKK